MNRWLMRSVCIVGLGCAIACQTVKPKPKPPQDPEVKAAPVVKEQTAEEAFAEGVTAFDSGKWEQALAHFKKSFKLDSSLPNAEYNVAVTLDRLGKVDEAVETYQSVLKAKPDHLPTLLNLGQLYRQQGRYDLAVALYRHALELPGKENEVPLLNNLSAVARLNGDLPLAEKSARQVLARSQSNAEAYKNLGLVYFDRGNYPMAEFLSQTARKLNDRDPGIHNNLGLVFLRMEKRDLAMAEFQRAVQLDPGLFSGQLNLGALALSYRDYETAEKAFSRAVALEPHSYQANLYYAFALDGQKGRDAKKGAEAGAAFEKVLAIKPDQSEAVCGAAWAYATDKATWDRALTFLEKCKAKTQDAKQVSLLDAKMKGLLAMKQSGQKQVELTKKEAPRPAPGQSSMIDKVSEEAAKSESTEATDGGVSNP